MLQNEITAEECEGFGHYHNKTTGKRRGRAARAATGTHVVEIREQRRSYYNTVTESTVRNVIYDLWFDFKAAGGEELLFLL